mmetsp:Transcript_20782/g.29180  ORF Transcript_20782/g.29180 Transcript_20782/m.29180 type:complete len:206 (+) Transcript_20782:220-837(+)
MTLSNLRRYLYGHFRCVDSLNRLQSIDSEIPRRCAASFWGRVSSSVMSCKCIDSICAWCVTGASGITPDSPLDDGLIALTFTVLCFGGDVPSKPSSDFLLVPLVSDRAEGLDRTWNGDVLILWSTKHSPEGAHSSRVKSKQKDWCLCLEVTSVTLSLGNVVLTYVWRVLGLWLDSDRVSRRIPCRMSCFLSIVLEISWTGALSWL